MNQTAIGWWSSTRAEAPAAATTATIANMIDIPEALEALRGGET